MMILNNTSYKFLSDEPLFKKNLAQVFLNWINA